MMRKILIITLSILLAIGAAGCTKDSEEKELEKVGLLITKTINDQVWGTNGYKGMMKIQSQYGTEVFYKERIDSQALVERSVEEFANKGVTLIFGHGHEYAEYFNKIAPEYPNIHFVSFNGNAKEKNTTSLKFEAHAMGFFGGMTAAEASKTGTIGILATFKWQPEVKGFVEGAKYQRPDIKVVSEFVDNWDDSDKALKLLERIIAQKADVVYPAGDGYNVPVIERLKSRNLAAIGYVSDQSDFGKDTVLTSTIQHVDKLYLLVAERFVKGKLKSGNIHFDFADGVISLSEFSPKLDEDFIKKINKDMAVYTETGKLPTKGSEESP
ncbi:BMP family ABC transporter substrate-binding protein [Bacillus xiapuensis]|uniref:BMP family ABC transporter substrate-binding protein n=1 Tax=Bacillus xiapuensis TaxID=2014075 RepID=UPI000C2408F5|nr:BMP family ABC transporter substrate-binding protein [Bacillus xiapuensis]